MADAPKTTDKGWYTVVDSEDSSTFIYVQKHGSKQLVCSAAVKSSMGPAIGKDVALKACESIKVK